ncbi:MAG TPA: DUF2164 domain-containing protein [Longimicrobium sp.]|nr:DUF2164 domain-containing protein [Longimicrobium sp.]
MRIDLSDERRGRLVRAVQRFFEDEFDEELSGFRAEALVDLFVRELGPPVYNQGVRDACGYMQKKLGDVEGEVYETEPR